MAYRILGLALRHRAIVTAMVLAGLLVNLVVIGTTESAQATSIDDLPAAAQCHGAGEGCASQPLIPPPAVGMPHVTAVAPISLGVAVLVHQAAPVDLIPNPPLAIERPPLSTSAA